MKNIKNLNLITRLICGIAYLCFLLINVSCTRIPAKGEKNSPEEVSIVLINNLLKRNIVTTAYHGQESVHYAEACAGFGAVRMAALLNDTLILEKLNKRYLKVITDSVKNTANHVDANVYGILPLELYKQTGEKRFLQQGIYLADVQWDTLTPEGLTWQTRYWIDDIWMIGSLQVQAYRITGNSFYLDRAAKEINAYVNKLQQSNGLFYHGESSPFHWGRGNGWVAAGLAELLTELPENHKYYNNIHQAYLKMMNALINYQASDGMWRQLIDVDSSWKETSSTAMFGYAMALGNKKGFLQGRNYEKAYIKAWNALTGYINEEGDVTEVCIGTGKGDNTQYYIDRPRIIGDLHGQAPMLWFAYALLM